ncbi:hypothetical protein [Corynebacterium caspium]|uniref:hypothetical protein n=1 Tax=Corynebacterium caspium TaxID=234828 RepID=UPI000369A28A|nr:hypothetical protein [Corynebacterium caspium]WKD58457.1 hypothetical protein CCASP_00100 [Corynebacterium caspium DSM 44850]
MGNNQLIQVSLAAKVLIGALLFSLCFFLNIPTSAATPADSRVALEFIPGDATSSDEIFLDNAAADIDSPVIEQYRYESIWSWYISNWWPRK